MEVGNANAALFTALAIAQGEVKTVGKDGTNTHDRRNYATAEAMIRMSRTVLAKNGISLMVSHSIKDCEAVEIGSRTVVGLLTAHTVLAHKDGGWLTTSHDIHVVASKRTPHDKAAMAALTYLHGFILRDLLNMDRAEEEAESVDGRQEPANEPQNYARQQRERPPVREPENLPDDPVAKFKRAYEASGHTWLAVCEEAELTIRGRPSDHELKKLWAALRRLNTEPPA